MGHAAHMRGNAVIARDAQSSLPSATDELLGSLNDLCPPDAPAPFRDTVVTFDGSVWWILDANKGFAGFGYHYPTARAAFRQWGIKAYAYGKAHQEAPEGFLCVPRR